MSEHAWNQHLGGGAPVGSWPERQRRHFTGGQQRKNNIVYYPAGTPITGAGRFTSSSNNLTTNPSFKNAASLPAGFTGTFGDDLRPSSDGLSVLPASPAFDAGAALAAAYMGSINSLNRPQGGWA